ncbi:hypothetical protein BSLG_005953 [Batrachochytrium salamandrivorans]|nr:hypothetical protein BSLG_005953 [Batrachochytrium salamandrivorans]
MQHPFLYNTNRVSLLGTSKATGSVTSLQTENRRLKEELAASSTQITASKSLDTTISSLKQRLSKYEAMIAQSDSIGRGSESIMLENLSKTNHPVTGGNIPGTADASIVSILTSQRDRYKQRFEEVEQNMREHIQTISDLRYEIANFKADNVKLYEKLRYAESYSNTRFQGTNNRHSSAVDITADRYSNNQLLTKHTKQDDIWQFNRTTHPHRRRIFAFTLSMQ